MTKIKENIYIQCFGLEKDTKDYVNQAKEDFIENGNKKSEIKTINIYIKPEDETVYYVVNDTFEGKIPLY